MDRAELKRLWDEVRANSAVLDGCAGPHVFRPLPPAFGPVPTDYHCEKCGGHVPHVAYFWYEKGRTHERAAR